MYSFDIKFANVEFRVDNVTWVLPSADKLSPEQQALQMATLISEDRFYKTVDVVLTFANSLELTPVLTKSSGEILTKAKGVKSWLNKHNIAFEAEKTRASGRKLTIKNLGAAQSVTMHAAGSFETDHHELLQNQRNA